MHLIVQECSRLFRNVPGDLKLQSPGLECFVILGASSFDAAWRPPRPALKFQGNINIS